MAGGVEFPPLTVVFDGSSYWLVDGFHRRFAAVKAKLDKFKCIVVTGTREDARWLSYGANIDHGMRRSTADKQKAVIAALKHPKGADKSDTKIAEHVGVDHKTVARQREKMESSREIPKIETRTVTRGGTTYEQNTANIGSKSKTAEAWTADQDRKESKKCESAVDRVETVCKGSDKKISGGTSFDPAELTSESKDAFGEQAPDSLRQAFELCEEFDAQRAKLTGIKSWITQRLAHPGAAVLVDAAQRIKTDIDQADAELKFAKPYCACIYCHNKPPKVANCSACKGRGWITEPIYKAAPKGLKREKAQA